MKYKIEGFSVVAKEITEETLAGGLLKKLNPIYDPIDLPNDAIGISIHEEVVAAVPPGAPRPLPGLEAAFMRKYKGVCRITYLVPDKPKLI